MKEIDEDDVLEEVEANISFEPENECSKLISELTKIKDEGNILYRKKKIDEAKDKFKEGVEKFETENSLINKDSVNNEKYKEVLLLYKKILSNLALCYYKQGKYKEAIDYDLKLIALYPKFGKSIVRLIKSYSKLNLTQQSVYYGDLFLDLEQETRDKFKDTQKVIQEEKKKLKNIQKEEKAKTKKNLNYVKYLFLPILVLILAILIFVFLKNNKGSNLDEIKKNETIENITKKKENKTEELNNNQNK